MASSYHQRQLVELLDERNKSNIIYSQDGVVIKVKAPTGDKQQTATLSTPSSRSPQTSASSDSYGAVFLIRGDNEATGANRVFLLWVPYTYLFCVAPHLLSPGVRRKYIKEESDLPLIDPSSPEGLTQAGKPEWSLTLCTTLAKIAKVSRRTNLTRRKILLITKVDRTHEQPMVFGEGGLTSLFDHLKKFVSLRLSPHSPDEFYVDPFSVDADSEFGDVSDSTVVIKDTSNQPESFTNAGSAKGNGSSGKKRTGVGSIMSSISKTFTGSRHRDPASGSGGDSSGVGSPGMRSPLGGNSSSAVAPIGVDRGELMQPKVAYSGGKSRGEELKASEWYFAFDDDGCITESKWESMKELIFRGGVEHSIRKEVWPYLLGMYSVTSTTRQRSAAQVKWEKDYATYKTQWTSMTEEQEANNTPYRERKVAIEKDVLRTDRTHALFAEEDGVHMRRLLDLLMTYATFNYDVGYCQGMSDMAALLLSIFDDEVTTFVAFKYLMQNRCVGNFCTGEHYTMPQQLQTVGELVRAFVPTLYEHFEKTGAQSMTFCFRWLVVWFKREFEFGNGLLDLWEAILSCPFTTQFEILVSAALLRHVSGQILESNLQYDGMLKFTNAMAMGIDPDDVLLITEEFYDYICQQWHWKSGGGVVDEGQAPTTHPTIQQIVDLWSQAKT